MANKDWSKVPFTEDMKDYFYEKYKDSLKNGEEVTDEMLDDLWNYAMVEVLKKGPSELYPTLESVFDQNLKPMKEDELFSMMGDPMEFVFETDCGAVIIRDNMQTLAPNLKIEANVIDSFAAVLNYEEKKNNKGVRMKHYFHTAMISKDMIEGKMKTEKKQIQAFHETMESVFKKDETAMAMQHIEWAFFPIIAHHHYYLVVFNLLKGTSVIIDNSNSGQTYDAKYKHVCDLLLNRTIIY
ncbi:Peptidase C48, SUMO/Sentrin/Ubl1 [Artemisia annua]|uniref:Peptidase C48, SUMO/Sentrin/Ubl1 n=1 Tax=Artemisia annua TaxID=35608 RepID=A0A2U1LDE4_ARTAN|nr:Peptidase C48, SUMO/Sentrin/Ubl1 [Artemisia annua]